MKKIIFILATVFTTNVSAGLFVVGMATANPVLAIPSLMAGGVLTINAFAEITSYGWTVDNTVMLLLGFIALDSKSGTLELAEISPEQARLLKVSTADALAFNQERAAMNAFNQSLVSDIVRTKTLTSEQLSATQEFYNQNFSSGARNVAMAISKFTTKN